VSPLVATRVGPALGALQRGWCGCSSRWGWLRRRGYRGIAVGPDVTAQMLYCTVVDPLVVVHADPHLPLPHVVVQVGADAAIFLRVFMLGLQLFSACSVVAVMLISVNSTGENKYTGLVGLSMANIVNGCVNKPAPVPRFTRRLVHRMDVWFGVCAHRGTRGVHVAVL
jgi:hypothetical protein